MVAKAIEEGEPYVASTIHVVEAEVDCGAPLAVSKRLILDECDGDGVKEIHEKLKQRCEHSAFPCLLESLSERELAVDNLPILAWFKRG